MIYIMNQIFVLSEFEFRKANLLGETNAVSFKSGYSLKFKAIQEPLDQIKAK